MTLCDENLYFIGGIVRDEILGLKSPDIDYCYEGNAIEFAQYSKLNIIRQNPELGTVRVNLESGYLDIASTRTEIYPKPGHLPKIVKIGCSLKEDLKRRDFTINALAKNTVSGEIVDLYNGLEDIKNKKLRVLHDKSFIDDPTRIIRGLKFSVRLGFDLDSETKKLQENYLANINYDMSYHRLKKELIETFNLNKKEALDKFIQDDMYKLLGKNQKIRYYSNDVEKIISENNITNSWILYLGTFDLSNLELTRQENKIIEWYERLKTQKATNHTPKESIIMHEIWEK